MSRRYQRDEFERPTDSVRQPSPDTRRRPESESQEHGSRGPNAGAAERQRDQHRDLGTAQRRSVEPRTPYRDQHWTYSLRASEIQTLRELGTFRAVDSEALAEIGYGGNRERMEQDLRNLIRQSLITRRGVEGREKERLEVLTLTKAGRRFLARQKLMPHGQPIYRGLVKPKEARHDAALYRLYHKAARGIERDGGRVRTVALDYELKKRINRELARLGADRHDPNRKIEIAQAHGVRVVNGRVVVPDLQIEYENAEGHLARVNLELATKNYRASQLQAKVQAGFILYAPAQDSDRLRRVLNDREITAEILSL
ncbi:MAG TPA: hypothetical protein VGR94_00285 [Candidatus Acidoferrales bacterium]|nr:hypothetical protein [Candidatus Acidoferrales bacterium]